MERTSGLFRGRSALMVVCLVSTLGLKAATSQALECYSCTDRGEGGCLPENVANISCSADHNVCLEAISAIRTSHHTHIVLKKGCGYDVEERLDKSISFHGISIFTQLHPCNGSLCNSNMDVRNYQLAADDDVSPVLNDEQCYGCIGKPREECSPSVAPVTRCYDSYNHCFDGIVTISINNDTTLIPIKSCSMRYRCAVQTLTYGCATFKIKGACCSGNLCNQDLSNKTQHGDMPFLVLLNDNNEEVITTDLPAPWITVTHTLPTTKGSIEREGVARSGNLPDNTAHGLLYSPGLIAILLFLS